MAGGLDTLCGQAYGAKQYHMVGVHTQRALIIFLIFSIPIALLSKEAGSYARWMIPSLFAYSFLQTSIRFVQTQNIASPIMLTTGITSLLHVPICWILVSKSGIGNKGAALANSVSYFVNVILLTSYEAFKNIAHFFRLAIPSTIICCLEWASYEILIILSGLLPNPKLEASVLAIGTRVSNELGTGYPRRAVFAVRVVLLLITLEGFLVGGITLLMHNVWGYCYSNKQEVVDYVTRLTPLLAIGTIRGCGKQKFGAMANLGAYYGVGIPMAIILGFIFHAGAMGLWMGIMCSSFVQGLSLLIMTLCTDWEQEVKDVLSM
ncbi:hypothetical protein AMTRI_Chr13g119430 [Amborella trichopoda]